MNISIQLLVLITFVEITFFLIVLKNICSKVSSFNDFCSNDFCSNVFFLTALFLMTFVLITLFLLNFVPKTFCLIKFVYMTSVIMTCDLMSIVLVNFVLKTFSNCHSHVFFFALRVICSSYFCSNNYFCSKKWPNSFIWNVIVLNVCFEQMPL